VPSFGRFIFDDFSQLFQSADLPCWIHQIPFEHRS
jgi:hypothetical protein